MKPDSEKADSFYRWVDAQGRLHVVSSLEQVPPGDRPKAEHVTLSGATSVGEYQTIGSGSWTSWRPDLPSLAVGFGAALVLSQLFRLLPGAWRGVTRLVVILGVGVLLTGLYLGAIRRSAGMPGGGALAAPSALIQDAKTAVEQMNARQKQQEEELRQIQAEGR
jgi:hypothetical protein